MDKDSSSHQNHGAVKLHSLDNLSSVEKPLSIVPNIYQSSSHRALTAKSRQRRPLVMSGGQPAAGGCANNWFNIFSGDEQTKTITTFSAKPEEILTIKKALAEKTKYRYSSTCGGGEVVNHDTKNDNKFLYYDMPKKRI